MNLHVINIYIARWSLCVNHRQHVTHLSRYILVYSSCHSSTADPDQDQHRQDQSCGQDPPWQPRVSIRRRDDTDYSACVASVGLDPVRVVLYQGS